MFNCFYSKDNVFQASDFSAAIEWVVTVLKTNNATEYEIARAKNLFNKMNDNEEIMAIKESEGEIILCKYEYNGPTNIVSDNKNVIFIVHNNSTQS